MKTCIALTFVGILTCAYAKHVTSGNCEEPNEDKMKNFDHTKLFKGTWYVSHVKKVPSPNVCHNFTVNQKDGKYIFGLGKEGNVNKVDCTAKKKETNLKKLTFNCISDNNVAFQSVYIVLGTDYDDYAVFYNCATLFGRKADNYVVIRRESGNEEIPEEAKGLTDNLNLNKCSEIKKRKAV
uniref:Salivary lipocalin n=1 Tax=Triatoma dimidiata TaxID=72491 RepID=D1MWE2_TRIDM|nr:hypothetical protein Td43 similar to lipocalin-like TiLipo37 [Triatoma dimidiata]